MSLKWVPKLSTQTAHLKVLLTLSTDRKININIILNIKEYNVTQR